MKIASLLPVACCLFGFAVSANAQSPSIEADHYKTILFEDDFSGDHLGSRWGMYKSASVVRDGVMVGITPDDADHPSVNTIRIDPQSDLEVNVSFKFSGSKRFQVMYRDRNCKSSHAGHICHVSVSPDSLTLYDGKTGIFRLDIRNKRKQKQPLDEATKQMLKTKSARFPQKLDATAWHQLTIRIQGDVMEADVDGHFVGRLQSEGLAHTTKDQVNLTTNKLEMHYDDFQIKMR
jgi:hypothetical protein